MVILKQSDFKYFFVCVYLSVSDRESAEVWAWVWCGTRIVSGAELWRRLCPLPNAHCSASSECERKCRTPRNSVRLGKLKDSWIAVSSSIWRRAFKGKLKFCFIICVYLIKKTVFCFCAFVVILTLFGFYPVYNIDPIKLPFSRR